MFDRLQNTVTLHVVNTVLATQSILRDFTAERQTSERQTDHIKNQMSYFHEGIHTEGLQKYKYPFDVMQCNTKVLSEKRHFQSIKLFYDHSVLLCFWAVRYDGVVLDCMTLASVSTLLFISVIYVVEQKLLERQYSIL